MITDIEFDESPLSIYPTAPINLRDFTRELEESVIDTFGRGAIVKSVHKSSVNTINNQVIYYYAVRLVNNVSVSLYSLECFMDRHITNEDGTLIYPIRQMHISAKEQFGIFMELFDLGSDDNQCCVIAFEIHPRNCYQETHDFYLKKQIQHDRSCLSLKQFPVNLKKESDSVTTADELNAINRLMSSVVFFADPSNICNIQQTFSESMFVFTVSNVNDIITYNQLQLFKISCRVNVDKRKIASGVYDSCLPEFMSIMVKDGNILLIIKMPMISSYKMTRTINVSSTTGVTDHNNIQKCAGRSISFNSPMRRSHTVKRLQNAKNVNMNLKENSLRQIAVSVTANSNGKLKSL